MPNKRYKDKNYLKWITTLPCILTKAGYYTHSDVIQAHHLLKPDSGHRGIGLKAHDHEVIPLCTHHHHLLHTKFGDEHKFFEHYGLDKNFGVIWARRVYEKRSWLDEQDDDYLPF